MSWIIGFYVISICTVIFTALVEKERKGRFGDVGIYVFFALCPGLNVLGFFACACEIYENPNHAKTVLGKLNLDFNMLDEESRKEMDSSKEQMENAIRAAKRLHTNQKEIIKRKSEKRKLCNKLGLTLEDLETIKTNRESEYLSDEAQTRRIRESMAKTGLTERASWESANQGNGTSGRNAS